jgi:hypothetical protein
MGQFLGFSEAHMHLTDCICRTHLCAARTNGSTIADRIGIAK